MNSQERDWEPHFKNPPLKQKIIISMETYGLKHIRLRPSSDSSILPGGYSSILPGGYSTHLEEWACANSKKSYEKYEYALEILAIRKNKEKKEWGKT